MLRFKGLYLSASWEIQAWHVTTSTCGVQNHRSCYHPQNTWTRRGATLSAKPGVMSLQPAVPRWGIVLKTPTFPTMGFFRGKSRSTSGGGLDGFGVGKRNISKFFEVCQTVRCQENSECAKTISLMYLMCRWGVTPRIKHTKKQEMHFQRIQFNFRRYISTYQYMTFNS